MTLLVTAKDNGKSRQESKPSVCEPSTFCSTSINKLVKTLLRLPAPIFSPDVKICLLLSNTGLERVKCEFWGTIKLGLNQSPIFFTHLKTLSQCFFTVDPAWWPELGENIHFPGPYVSGSALVNEGFVLHLSGFPNKGFDKGQPKVPFQRFSQRKKMA